MALQYTLVVLATTTPEALWPRLRRTPPELTIRKGVWTADEREEVGYIITMRRDRDGYYEFDGDVREPADYLRVGFREDRDHGHSPQRLAHNLLELVQNVNVLDSGDEDLWLSFDGEELILERIGGEVRRLPAGFWNNVED